MAEREALAQMIATLPVALPRHIVQTPAEAEPIDLESLRTANLYFLIMGADIRAPVGLELHTAQQAGQSVAAYFKQNIPYTPAGQVFTRQARLNWQPFSDATNLSRQIRQIIVKYLLQQAITYALTPTEIAQLERIQHTPEPQEQNAQAEGTGHSAVLLSPERYIPSEGIIVEESH